jgi:Flp pilus assembly protein TadB
MPVGEPDFIEMRPGDQDDEFVYEERKQAAPKGIKPWKAKLIFWSILVGGVAIGAIIFFTFVSLFVYFFVPIMIFTLIWTLINYFRGR